MDSALQVSFCETSVVKSGRAVLEIVDTGGLFVHPFVPPPAFLFC